MILQPDWNYNLEPYWYTVAVIFKGGGNLNVIIFLIYFEEEISEFRLFASRVRVPGAAGRTSAPPSAWGPPSTTIPPPLTPPGRTTLPNLESQVN